MRTIKDIPDLQGKKVLLRTDFDVPIVGGKIAESFRIQKQKELIDYLINKGARVVLVAHISKTNSFRDILEQLQEILCRHIQLLQSIEEIPPHLVSNGNLALLENIRSFDGEKGNDERFAQRLSRGFDIYINNAFAVSHRGHASISAITKFLPAYAGFIIEKEVYELQKVLSAPVLGKVVVIGGAKAETKIPVVQNFFDKADKIIVGGIVANDILKVQGEDIGVSTADKHLRGLMGTLDVKSDKLVLPTDFDTSNNRIYDIGPQSIEKFQGIIRNAKMIIWNGPMGMFEDEHFAKGTHAVARAICDTNAISIVGGGDTISAIDHWELLHCFSFVSTGGGAMLEFLAGKALPGIMALQNND